jgi:hypothetical protein
VLQSVVPVTFTVVGALAPVPLGGVLASGRSRSAKSYSCPAAKKNGAVLPVVNVSVSPEAETGPR